MNATTAQLTTTGNQEGAAGSAKPAPQDEWSAFVLRHRAPALRAQSLTPEAKRHVPAWVWNHTLLDPVTDILGRPSKGFRAGLVDIFFRMLVPQGKAPAAAMALVEILHAGSLIVDDIQDQSPSRRGGAALHHVYGTPRALNAGNWMYFFAIEQIENFTLPEKSGLAKAALYARVNRTLMDCHRGQGLDVSMRLGHIGKKHVSAVVAQTSALKTGALMELSAALGIIAAGGTDAQITAAARFGGVLGVALQQLDDLGNISPLHPSGKRYEDLNNGRLTWPWAWAAETSDQVTFARWESLQTEISSDLERPENPEDKERLANWLRSMCGRERKLEIVGRVQKELARLATVFGSPEAIKDLHIQLAKVETSYV